MKSCLPESFRSSLLGAGLTSALAALVLAPSPAAGTDPIWVNTSFMTNAPQVDATIVVNQGIVTNVQTMKVIEFSNAQVITNRGMLSASPGWYFNQSAPTIGYRGPLDTFYNSGVIESYDAPSSHALHNSNPSRLWVFGTNVVNRGLMRVGADGWLQLTGTNVNLQRGGLEVMSITPIGNILGSNIFWSDIGVYDNYWAQNTEDLNTAGFWDGLIASTPMHVVESLLGQEIMQFDLIAPWATSISNNIGRGIGLSVTNIDGSVTNVTVPTNIVKQAIFVSLNNDPAVEVAMAFAPSTSATNPMMTAAVRISHVTTNYARNVTETNYLYFYDLLASSTRRGLDVNQTEGTGRPACYVLSRVPEMMAGIPGQGYPDPTFFYNRQTFSNSVAEGVPTAAYSAYVINNIDEPPAIPAGTVTNVPGRVLINAETLDLNNARIRGEGEIRIKAKNMIPITNAPAIDCENLSYFLGSGTGSLKVSGLAKDSVARMKGDIYAWSAYWQNQMTIITTNYDMGTNNTPTEANYTNTANLRMHCLMLDASILASQLPVLVHEFETTSPDVVIDDSMVAVQSFYVDGTSLTINGSVTLSNRTVVNLIGIPQIVDIPNFMVTNAPNLAFFTNNGKFWVRNEAHFGEGRLAPYESFVNTGSIDAFDVAVKANYFQNSGQIRSGGSLYLTGTEGRLENGINVSGGDTEVTCQSVKLNKYSLTASRSLRLAVSGALYDAGPGSANNIIVSEGLELATKPAAGDLLGTSLQCKAPDFFQIDHIWAGEERFGTNNAGYTDNVALGQLVLGPVGSFPLLYFAPASGQNAMYVDLLDLTALGANWEDYLQIADGMRIYYAAVKLGFAVPSTTSPEEYLDGQMGGKLKWVPTFAGANSSVDVIKDGLTVRMNKALRDSRTIDTDGDGIPNYNDEFPLGGAAGSSGGGGSTVIPSLVKQGSGQSSFAVTWTAAANSAYQIDYRTNLTTGAWQLLGRYTNNSLTSQTATMWDTNAPAMAPQRFYRVGRLQ